MNNYFLLCDDKKLLSFAKDLTDFFEGFVLITDIEIIIRKKVDVFLFLTQETLFLVNALNNLRLDIADIYKKTFIRLNNLNKELLINIVKGLNKKDHTIIDLTAGFGIDALILAACGNNLTLMEINPIIYVILIYAKFKGYLLSQMQLIFNDAKHYLESNSNPLGDFDIIYLDPMFDDINTTTPKKNLQFIQILNKNFTTDYLKIFDLVFESSKKIIIVKRYIHEKPISLKIPDKIYAGKIIRYDVYKT